MKNKLEKLLIAALTVAFIGLFPQELSAQTDSIKPKDTVNSYLLSGYNQKLKRSEQQRIADSLKKAELERELTSLKTTDNLKRRSFKNNLKRSKRRKQYALPRKKKELILCVPMRSRFLF